MSSGKKGSRPGGSRQPPDTIDDQAAPSRPFSLPLGYYDYYGIPLPKGVVQAKRSLYPGRSLPRGYLEYYGIVQPATSNNVENPASPKADPAQNAESTDQHEADPVPSAAVRGTNGNQARPPDQGVQAKSAALATETEAVHEAARRGTSGASERLPHLGEIQKAFGHHDVTGVQAHTDPGAQAGARAMGAEAFTTGNHVAFAGAPSLHTAAHEAAHVIQQRGGVQLKGGVGQAGDAYEQHADAVADAVVQGKSSEALLDRDVGAVRPPPDAYRGSGDGFQPAPSAIQRKIANRAVVQMQVVVPNSTAAEPTEADVIAALQTSPVNIQQVLDLLRALPPPDSTSQLDMLIETLLSGDARWRARNIRQHGPEAQWPPVLRSDTAGTISAARALITSGTAPAGADAVADALRPLNPTALHQVITLWRSDIPGARFGGDRQRREYFDIVMAQSGGPSFAPIEATGVAPILDLETRSEAELYSYFQHVASTRGFAFTETDLSSPSNPIQYTAFNIRGYDLTTSASSAIPRLNASEFTGHLFLVWRDSTGQHVRNWPWSNTGTGSHKLNDTHNRGDQLLASEGHTQSFDTDMRGQVSAVNVRAATISTDGNASATQAAIAVALAQIQVIAAVTQANQAKQLSATRANASIPMTGTRAVAEAALTAALQARSTASLAILHADRAIKLLHGVAPTGNAAAPSNSMTLAQQALTSAQTAFKTARDAWLIARQQGLATDEETARREWERLQADASASAADRQAARQRYDQARTHNNNGLGGNNIGEMSETNAIPWLQEGQYVARLREGSKLGARYWSVNAGMEGPNGTNGYTPADRDWNANGVIDPGERDVPGTAMGTGVLIHRGDNPRWSIGCQVAPANPYHEFVTALSGGGSPASRFAYIVVEAQHMPPWAPAGGAGPRSATTLGSGGETH